MEQMEMNMSNVAIFGGGGGKVALNDTKAMKAALDNSVQDDPRGSDEDGVYINFSGKRGLYEIGADKNNADPDEIWLVNIGSFQTGWICWKGGRPVAKRMASIYGAPTAVPDMDEHGPFNAGNGEGWSIAKSMVLRSLDSGVQGIFTTNSKSGVSSLVGIQKEISEKIGEGSAAWAVVHLQKEAFTAQGNKNFKPVFPIYGWLGDAQVTELSTMDTVTSEIIDELLSDAEEGVMGYTMPDIDDDADPNEPDALQSADDNVPDEPVDEPVVEPKPSRRAAAAAAPPAGRRRRAAI
jgi:hypothetical protein